MANTRLSLYICLRVCAMSFSFAAFLPDDVTHFQPLFRHFASHNNMSLSSNHFFFGKFVPNFLLLPFMFKCHSHRQQVQLKWFRVLARNSMCLKTLNTDIRTLVVCQMSVEKRIKHVHNYNNKQQQLQSRLFWFLNCKWKIVCDASSKLNYIFIFCEFCVCACCMSVCLFIYPLVNMVQLFLF